VRQERDSLASPDASGPFPASDEELGAALKRLRGRRTLQELADASGISRATLARYEAGKRVSLRYAATLDDALNARGWVSTSVARLRQPTWAPWVDQVSARTFAHRWPAAHNGTVWTHVVPVPQNVGAPHLLRLSWGPWHRDVTVKLDRAGRLLTTGKAKDEDGVAVTFHLDCDLPVYVVFGAGEAPGQPQLDIRDGWSRW
jgi:hypothetical protein